MWFDPAAELASIREQAGILGPDQCLVRDGDAVTDVAHVAHDAPQSRAKSHAESYNSQGPPAGAGNGKIPIAYVMPWIFFERDRPSGAPYVRWLEARRDGEIFLARWGLRARSLGWPARSLFEWRPDGPSGLLWELRGREVVVLEPCSARMSPTAECLDAYFIRERSSE